MSIGKESNLAKFLQANSQSDVLSRGRSIFRSGTFKVKLLDISGRGYSEFKVDSEYYGSKYKVEVTDFNTASIKTSCTCPYNYGGICKHRVAAILYLLDKIPAGEPVYFQMLATIITLPKVSDELLKDLVMPDVWKNRNVITVIKIEEAKDEQAVVNISYKKEDFEVKLKRLKNTSQIHTTCSCNQRLLFPLCEHKLAAFRKLKDQFGERAFDMMRDWTDEKNKMLAEYGFSLNDELKNKFDFKITNKGQLQLVRLDPTIQKIGSFQNWTQVREKYIQPQQVEFLVATEATTTIEDDRRVLFYTFMPKGANSLLDFDLGVHTAKLSPKTKKYTYIRDYEQSVYRSGHDEMPPDLDEADMQLIRLAKFFTLDGILNYVRSQKWTTGYYFDINELSIGQQREARNWIGKKLEKVFQSLIDKTIFSVQSEYVTASADLQYQLTIHQSPVRPFFVLKEEKDFMTLEPFVEIEAGKPIELQHVAQFKSYWLGQYRTNTLFRWAGVTEAEMVNYFRENGFKMKVKKEFAQGFLTDWVVPMTENFDVDFQIRQQIDSRDLNFEMPRIYLKEDSENFIVVPVFVYGDMAGESMEFMNDQRKTKAIFENDTILMLQRNSATERDWWDYFKGLHPDFEQQFDSPFFYIPFGNVLKDNWLFKFFDELKEKNIEVFGQKDLKKMRFNPNRGVFNIRASSGIDWFDMEVGLSFGEQHVSLSDAKKALLKKQNYVELKDGTLGILPEDWIKKIEPLLKFGIVKGDNIKLSKLHFSLIDELSAEIDSVAVQQELYEKKQKLLNFKEMASVPVPQNVTATLRHYQEEGFKWMNFLNEFGWGGCLADDMGLGKTLQVLTLLQQQKNLYPDATNLVVVPTTLIFNWQAEAAKFTPELKLHVHRGLLRVKDALIFREHDIVLTTYGTMRSDIEILRKFEFNYVVLDESQAVKNPDSLTSKAVRLLSAKYRLTMTGTPVENNTFDLYSQMEFLNPGYLGNAEFFKTEYANAIDKHQDPVKAAELRKLVYPFMLKRTKEEVAKDLPDKTETILYCEMGDKQRKVYETFREKYRQQIADKMATEGLNKSSFLILEALLKLRQICDSPALLSDDADYGTESAKLEEIIREIQENASNHKILIFSQFLKMLDLIKTFLEKHNIVYEYLDGQTTDRADRVNRFQSDKSCRVFLMSLKAGGVGLNLTEADYVYLIDPWWNPAVEAQAIDRTHRIGQTKKVFAYKMICKDTIEEKILTLQQRKKDIAEDIVSAEAGFLKKLTREDIVDLFS